MIRIVIAIAAALTFTGTALAQSPEATPQKAKEIIFEPGEKIEGELAQANYLDVTSLGDHKLPTLIRVRTSFSDYMIKDVEDLP